MCNIAPDSPAFTFKSPLRQAGAPTPITQGHARTPFQNLLARPLAIGFVFSFSLFAQRTAPPPALLHYSGQPVRLPFECVEEDLQLAGLVCTDDEPCPVFLELSGISSAGKKLFVSGNLHSATGTLSAVLLASDDNGATWREPAGRIRGSAVEQVEFHDLEHGWAAGDTQVPLPRDPFFLVTDDGGRSWRTRPVTEEGGPGSVHRFWFDTGSHGELVVDAGKSSPGGRYIDYESETGGESWMVRGIGDRLPVLKRAPPAGTESDLRLRASPAGNAWLAERRDGEKWVTAAAFLIEVAACRVKPPEAREPPPEPAAEPEPDPDKDYVEEIKLGGAPQGKPPAAAPPKKKASKP